MKPFPLQPETTQANRQRFFIWDGSSVHSEITNESATVDACGWLAFDDQCPLCTRWAGRLERILARRRIMLVPLRTPWVRQRLGLTEGRRPDRIWLLLPGGEELGGADAIIELARRIGWARPFAFIAGLPGIRHLLHAGYNFIARRRTCIGDTCTRPATVQNAKRSSVAQAIDLLPLVILPAFAIALAPSLPAFLFMWALAAGIFTGFKWLTFRRAAAQMRDLSFARTFTYLLAWPGMEAKRFLDESRTVEEPRCAEWLFAGAKTCLGIALIWGLTPRLFVAAPLLAGWTLMVGLIFLLHFGLFHFLSVLWRTAGIDAQPMMRNPLRATSLADFWGRRWNRDFNVLARDLVVKPLHRRIGAGRAMLLVFLFSGLIHDLVISLPSGAGFGLPTAFFLLQACGLTFERSRTGRALGLGNGLCGWVFTFTLTALPAIALFHPWFVSRIILPFAQAIGAA
ncbi:MAG: DCC1-like thiol-disulfide oxidoreductase family protein [Phycisphaeraceae bacterium]